MAMRTDYDARRAYLDTGESLEELKARHAKTGSVFIDIDEAEPAEGLELPGGELRDEELTVTVMPMQVDEFRCDRCFLIRHHSQRYQPGGNVCHECA